MNTQSVFVLAIAALAVCSIAFMLSLPPVAATVAHGNLRRGVRLAVPLGLLAAAALAISVALGVTPASYSILG